MEKENLQNTRLMIIRVCPPRYKQKKKTKKRNNEDKNLRQLRFYSAEFWSQDKTDAYARKYIYMNGMRHYFLYTNIFTIMTGMLAYQRVYMCCIYVFKKSGIFLSSYFIMSERVRTQKRERKMRR
jgi:hypothetical protein